MSNAMEARLREFTENVLIRSGALVEWPASPNAGLALLPRQAAALLQCPETVKLTCQPDGEGLCANLATDFLDRIAPLVSAEPRVALFQMPELYLKKGDLAEAVSRAFTWHNAKVVVRDAQPEPVEYHAWHFLASVISEDRWEDVLQVTVNAASQATVALPDPMAMPDLEPSRAPQPEGPSTYQTALRETARQLQRRAAPFIGRLDARLERDRKRLRDYYGALLREETGKKHRLHTPEDPQKRQERRRAVELELARKLAELDDRYAIQAELTPITLIRLALPALAVGCEVFRKQARRMQTIYWNPLLKELEPLSCTACGASSFSIAFTNTDVKPLCSACASKG